MSKQYKYNDGGRKAAGLKTKTDCGIRAMAIACQIPYSEARERLKDASEVGRMGSRAIARGVYKEDMTHALAKLGWSWRSAPKFKGRKARYSDMPKGERVIVRMAKHFAAVCDGELNDTWDSSRKMVYGYWSRD
jgi:hypothetical protein